MSTLPFPDDRGEPLRLVGIAKLAAESDAVGAGHQVEYLALDAKSVLTRCTAAHRMPFTWTVNPYRGCEFGCKYCYARYTHEFMELRDGMAFEQRIFVKQHAAWLLRRDLARVRRSETIAIGTATDPYQPAERNYGVTRAILEELTRHAGLDIGIITKSNLIVRDLELFQRIAAHNDLWITITVTTTDTRLARILEPRAPRPDLRLQAVRTLATAGLAVGVNCAPVLPGITDDPQNLRQVVAAAAAAGAGHVHTNPLFLKPCSAQVFLPFLERSFPDLVERYQRQYATRAFVSADYRRRLAKLITELRREYGLPPRQRKHETAPAADAQASLFEAGLI